jgi:hypothetical protein
VLTLYSIIDQRARGAFSVGVAWTADFVTPTALISSAYTASSALLIPPTQKRAHDGTAYHRLAASYRFLLFWRWWADLFLYFFLCRCLCRCCATRL